MKSKALESALESVSRVITDKYGIRLCFEGDDCRTDGKTIHLPSLPDEVPEKLLSAIRGWSDHESAHIIFTETELAKSFLEDHCAEAFGILNTLEDARIERLMSERYAGSRANMEAAFEFVSASAKANPESLQLDPLYEFTSALYTRASDKPDQLWLSPKAYRLVDEVKEELRGLQCCRNTPEVALVAEKVWEKVKAHFPQQSLPHEPSQEPKEESKEKEEESQGQEQRGEAENDPANTQVRGNSENTSGALSQAAFDTGGGFGPMDALAPLIAQELKKTYSENHGSYRVYTREQDVIQTPPLQKGFDYRKEMQLLRPYVAGLRRRLLQTLMGKERVWWLRDRTRGSLDPRALHRLVTSTSARVFRQRRENKGGNTACALLLDLSASMNKPKLELCRQLGLIFAETLNILAFPTEIIGFSTLDTDMRSHVAQTTGISEEELSKRYTRFVPLYLAIYKEFSEPWKKAAARLGGLRSKCLTPLGESLLFAARRLALRQERRKVLFCITDGKPVIGAWDEQVTFNHARKSVKRIEAAGIEPVGIGIQETCVGAIFPRHAIIHDLQELPRTFLKQLCEVLTAR